jgi:hypothetical protein
MKMTTTIVVLVVIVTLLAAAWLHRRRSVPAQFQATDEMMHYLASEAVDIAAKSYGMKLDYSTESIAQVEAILGKLHDEYVEKKSTEGLQGLAMAFGAYIGEAIKRSAPDARWGRDHPVAGEKSYPLHWLGGDSFPCGWCYKRMVNGPEDNVWHKYTRLKQERIEPGHASDAEKPRP